MRLVRHAWRMTRPGHETVDVGPFRMRAESSWWSVNTVGSDGREHRFLSSRPDSRPGSRRRSKLLAETSLMMALGMAVDDGPMAADAEHRDAMDELQKELSIKNW